MQNCAEITAYLNIQTVLPARADFAIIFGTRLPDPVPIAARLYLAQIVPKLVVTGGINKITQRNEAQAHYQLLQDLGIPPNHIIVEDQSTNTLQNVTFTLPKIQEVINDFKSVIAVCKWMHARRAIMTMKAHFPRGVRYFVSTYIPYGVTPENWCHLDEQQQYWVLKNWEGIPQYLAKGHIAETEFDGEAYI
jgi:vancomycin permeability regulator SanA